MAPPTEADLEARLSGVLRQAFPLLGPGAIRHQLRFKLRLGHKQIEIDATAIRNATGHLDILLTFDDRPLAVLELKRAGLALQDDDRRQVLSYARLLEPMAPLAIVTNGGDTRFFETVSGDAWPPDGADAATLRALFENASRLAAQDMDDAIATLLAPHCGAARAIIRSLSAATVDDLTGAWHDGLRPFADGISFVRKATMVLARALDSGRRFIILSGPPLVGKSNVLRQLHVGYGVREDAVVLYVEGGAARHGLFRLMADAFSRALNWNVDADAVRRWLMGISHRGSFRLILAIDDADAESMGSELDGLVSSAFGDHLQIVLSCDTGTAEKFTATAGGRRASPFGRHAVELELGLLDQDEFQAALAALDTVRINFMRGAQRAWEYRHPWVLRTIAAEISQYPNYADTDVAAAIPSLPGLKLMAMARRLFEGQEELRGRYAAFAEALLEDLDHPQLSLTTALISGFVCRRETLLRHLSDSEFKNALGSGEFKTVLLADDVRAVAAQIPALAALALSYRLAALLLQRVGLDAAAAADFLVSACGRFALGDVIGAHALAEAAIRRGGLPLAMVTELLERPPRREKFQPGAQLRMIAGNLVIDAEVGPDGELIVRGPDGERQRLPLDDDDKMTADTTPWMILSYFAAMPIAAIDENADVVGWVDTHVLETVAACPDVLRHPAPGMSDGLVTHHLPGASVVCHKEGIVEPITLALFYAVADDRRRGEYLVGSALADGSPSFLLRLFIAFDMVSQLVDEERRCWARDLIHERLVPRMEQMLIYHPD